MLNTERWGGGACCSQRPACSARGVPDALQAPCTADQGPPLPGWGPLDSGGREGSGTGVPWRGQGLQQSPESTQRPALAMGWRAGWRGLRWRGALFALMGLFRWGEKCSHRHGLQFRAPYRLHRLGFHSLRQGDRCGPITPGPVAGGHSPSGKPAMPSRCWGPTEKSSRHALLIAGRVCSGACVASGVGPALLPGLTTGARKDPGGLCPARSSPGAGAAPDCQGHGRLRWPPGSGGGWNQQNPARVEKRSSS